MTDREALIIMLERAGVPYIETTFSVDLWIEISFKFNKNGDLEDVRNDIMGIKNTVEELFNINAIR